MLNNKLSKIQQYIKVPKGQTNNFGKYKYRSCEDILESVKPLLGDCTLTITDYIDLIGDRYYVIATAILKCGDETIETTACAREPTSKKGMDESQITGTASSYARKYALNGLFAIDDTKDADTMDNSKRDIDKELKDCLTLVELKTLWASLNETEKTNYTKLKNEIKTKLEG